MNIQVHKYRMNAKETVYISDHYIGQLSLNRSAIIIEISYHYVGQL